MERATIEALRRKPDDERARGGRPEGFPQLPQVPAGRYGDVAFAELERRHVFGRTWLFVAHDDQLADPGDFLQVEAIPEPVFLVRGHDHVVRAFHNTCMHRGSALVLEPSGHVGRRLTCPYHSWVYTLDGKLAGYPDAGNFGELDTECLALAPVRCEAWGPFLFINLDPSAVPLREALRPVSDDLHEIETMRGRLHLVGRRSREVPVNWKLPVDANIETYHVNTVHRESAGLFLDQARTAIWLFGGGHSRMLITTRDGVGPLPQAFPAVFHEIGDLPELGTFSYHVFPNLSIVFGGLGFVFFIANWPTGPTTSRYDVHFFSSLAPADDSANRNERMIASIESVLWEDLSVLPGMQHSIDAGALRGLTLNYQERRIYHVHEQIDRNIGVERIADALKVTPALAPFVEPWADEHADPLGGPFADQLEEG
jgi:phenylpropionate dioxygenase-like ring-hydroxylating dioxygenase large terminal subunit